jgi:hypothetical protein
MGRKMSEKSSLDEGKTLKQKLEAARAGEFSPEAISSRSRSGLTFPVLVALLAVAGTAIAFATAFPWLLQQPREVIAQGSWIGVALIVVESLVLFILVDRGTDEWHRSAARFSSQWGHIAGLGLVLLLLAPLSQWIGSWAPDGERRFVQIGFTLGFLVVMIAQVVCVALMRVGWTFWMSRSTREPYEKQD